MDKKYYKTFKKYSKVERIVKDSLFIGYGKPVSSEKEAKEFILKIKEIHKDATHNVSAYRINSLNNFSIKYDDDGEPQGSSGKPIYRVIELKDIQNVVIVVTRYFGGTKLGYGGILKAYLDTASEVITSSEILEVFQKSQIFLEFEYSHIETIKKAIENLGKIIEETYFEKVRYKVEVNFGFEEELIKKLVSATKNNIKIENINSNIRN
ncbi:protein of unknown function UPF0029 [Methanococcus vannielii SB]|uniref:Impact N-terminal domain-containing protein n=1 Tax=Methanococcus vannielii (strain ATCC 35089 / DSM 1224 / JCM 13029 / OCM 148 / SB) TaxID=406327 RepID=A6UP69_METVS|nr:YigZ family protein [Methanococcus vannielii]ABR54291.1 protein of unknown function UPF0029 [Methanococcus vannielii SB]